MKKRLNDDPFDPWDPMKLIKARTVARLSQSDLADILGVSRNAVSMWEQGRSPRVDKRVTLESWIAKHSEGAAVALQDDAIMRSIDEAAAVIRASQRTLLALSDAVEKIRDAVRAARVQ